MEIRRKLNNKVATTDFFKDITGKVYEIKNDHKTYLEVMELLNKKNMSQKDSEEANEKALGLIIGEENWKEIKAKLEEIPNYSENSIASQIEIFSICYGMSFDEMAKRFQNAVK